MKTKIIGIFLLFGALVFAQDKTVEKIHNEEYFQIRQNLNDEDLKIFDKVIHEKYNKIDLNNSLIKDTVENKNLSQDEKNVKIDEYKLENKKLEDEIREEMDKYILRMNKK